MAGCDYLDEIKGIGMNTAQKVISKNYTLKKSLMTLCQLSKKK
jgi:5'-3' exonuclease